MGCCFSNEDEPYSSSTSQNPHKANKKKKGAFTGAGNRLGTGATTDETSSYRKAANVEQVTADVAPIRVDGNLNDDDRERIRAERVAAAEKRLLANGGGDKKKPKKKGEEEAG